MFQRYRGQSWRSWADRLVDELLQRSHFLTLEADYTLTSTTAAQALFSPRGSLYLTEGFYRYSTFIEVTGMSATSGNAAFSLAGTATVNGSRGRVIGGDATIGTVGNLSGQTFTGASTAASMVTATTATAMTAWIDGIFNVAAAGTVEPRIALVTAAAAAVKAASFMEIRRVADRGIARIGDWR